MSIGSARYHSMLLFTCSQYLPAFHFGREVTNARKNRSSHLFQGRYKSIIVDRDSYLGELSRYIHLNPARAGLVRKPEDYRYSSYRVYLSGKGDNLVSTEVLLDLVRGRKSDARKRYRAFVEAGLSYSAVTKTCRRLQEEIGKRRWLRTLINQVDRELSYVKG